MSGGAFDYDQHRIRNIADTIDQFIRNNGKKIEYPEAYELRPFDDTHHPTYPPQIIEKFKEALVILKQAEVYAQRIDWYISGDDGEESFFERLEEDLNQIKS
jgi:hypothetical protein